MHENNIKKGHVTSYAYKTRNLLSIGTFWPFPLVLPKNGKDYIVLEESIPSVPSIPLALIRRPVLDLVKVVWDKLTLFLFPGYFLQCE